MKLHPNWWKILTCGWSIRLMFSSAVLSGVGTALTIAQPYLGVSPLVLAGIVGAITTLVSLIGIYARVVKQEGLD